MTFDHADRRTSQMRGFLASASYRMLMPESMSLAMVAALSLRLMLP